MHLLDWCEGDRDAAVVWFAHSNGLSQAIEALRRDTNERLLAELVKAVKSHSPRFSLPHAGVVSAALIALIEICARGWLLREDDLFEAGEEDFRLAVDQLANAILAVPTP